MMSIIFMAVVLIVVWAVVAYNSFVKLINRVKEAWSDIDVQLKRRYDLIPNLVNTVKGYATHESAAFESVTQARAAAMGAGTPDEKGKAENTLSSSLKSLFAVAEAYPDLKANAGFLELQHELADTEDKIQASRRFYNGSVMALNTSVDLFPSNVIARIFRFGKAELFSLPETETAAIKKPVEVKF